jgi:hypothetical protein
MHECLHRTPTTELDLCGIIHASEGHSEPLVFGNADLPPRDRRAITLYDSRQEKRCLLLMSLVDGGLHAHGFAYLGDSESRAVGRG